MVVYSITVLSPTGENSDFDSRKQGFERKTERGGGVEESSGRQKSGKICTFAMICINHRSGLVNSLNLNNWFYVYTYYKKSAQKTTSNIELQYLSIFWSGFCIYIFTFYFHFNNFVLYFFIFISLYIFLFRVIFYLNFR